MQRLLRIPSEGIALGLPLALGQVGAELMRVYGLCWEVEAGGRPSVAKNQPDSIFAAASAPCNLRPRETFSHKAGTREILPKED